MITHNNIKYVIVQAGGLGTRLGKYTKNRPKCLVPVNGTPMIENILEVYKNKKVIIIGDTHFDVLLNYLQNVSQYNNYILHKTNEKGTAAGISEALKYIPEQEPFIITWSDLYFEKEQEFEFDSELLVGLAGNFDCRWSLHQDGFKNIPSQEKGVSGFFIFKNKKRFDKLTTDKSLVRGFLSDYYQPNEITSFTHQKCFEVGTLEKYEKLLSQKINHRFFNEVNIKGNKVYKKCVNPKYSNVHQAEKEWYKFVLEKGYTHIPQIYSTEPLIISKINGNHAWNIKNNKDKVIENYCRNLSQLHSLSIISSLNHNDCFDTYLSKPIERVLQVKSIIKDFEKPVININGKSCRNPFCDLESFEKIIKKYLLSNNNYTIIHGDCTFSNTLVDSNNYIWMIDPRGIFGKTKIYGDPRYDWAKLYYSAVGNYDKINSQQFEVIYDDIGVNISIESNGYEQFGKYIIQESKMFDIEMFLIHSSIWFSLSGYVKEDVDAILYSFYKGCQIWTECLTLI